MQYLGYYGYPYYLGGGGLWGNDLYPWTTRPGDSSVGAPAQLGIDPVASSGDLADVSSGTKDSRQRSCDTVTRYFL